MIVVMILLWIIVFLIWMAFGRESNAKLFCRHEWEEAIKKSDKHWIYIWYVCKKCKWTRTACFDFDETK